jgi:hypothetical protein
VPSQPSLRPFDIAVALRLLLVPEERYEPLAEALVTSTSAVHRSVARLQLAGLCQPSSRTVARDALREFLLHGARYAFPAVHGPERTGLATAWTHPDVAALFTEGESPRGLVWSSDRGTVRGELLVPLFPNIPGRGCARSAPARVAGDGGRNPRRDSTRTQCRRRGTRQVDPPRGRERMNSPSPVSAS